MMTATYAGLTQRKSNRLLSDKPKVRILYPVPQGQHGECSKRLAAERRPDDRATRSAVGSKYVPLAQLVELRTLNSEVQGSNP